MRASGSARIALTATRSMEEAHKLAHALVDRRLAACVNIIPGVASVYRWQGAVEESSEILLMIKTAAERLPALETALHELHSYDVPEFVSVPISAGSQPYLDWLFTSVAP